MSIHVMSLVWKKSRHKGSALLWLLCIADFAHDDGAGAWPSIQTQAEKTRLSTRNVQMIQQFIAHQKNPEVIIDHGAGPFGVNAYVIQMDQLAKQKSRWGEKFAPRKNFTGVQPRAKRVQSSARGVQSSARNRVKPVSPKPNRHTKPSVQPPPAEVAPLSDYLLDTLRHLGIAQDNVARLAEMPHVTESYILAWARYSDANKKECATNPKGILRGGFFFKQMKEQNLPPDNDTAVFAAKWRREIAERQA